MPTGDDHENDTPTTAAAEAAEAPAAGCAQPEPPPPDPLAEAHAKIEALEQGNAEIKDRLLRVAADFDNFKKRSRKELGEAADRGREALLREILPVLDNLERAIAHAEGAEATGGLIEGVRLVLRQLLTALEKFEVRPFTALGEAFDPQYHAAIQQVESDQPAGMVVEEYQKGYTLGQRLLRPALVAVARPPQPPAPPPEEPAPDSPGEGG
jgi:molecular chaperone GrpE